MLGDHRAWFTEHFSSEDPWPEGELAAKMAEVNLAAARRQDGLADELEQLDLVPQDADIAAAMRQTASMLRLWAARHTGAAGHN
jgi:hypothetical protein